MSLLIADVPEARDPSARMISMSDYYGDEGPGTGGAGVSALRIADVLSAAGVRLDIIAGFAYPRDRRGEPQVTFLDDIDLREAAKHSPSALAAGIWNHRIGRDVRLQLRKYDAERTVVMLHQWTRSLSPATLAAVAAYPHIVYVHDYFWACPTGSYFNYRTNTPCTLRPMGAQCMTTVCDRVGAPQKAYRVLRHLVKAAAVAGSDARRVFVHISERSRQLIEPLFPASTHATIYHPIGSTPTPVPSALEFDLGYFGRLEPEKGVLELAAAAARTGSTCLFVGTGSQSEELRRRFPHVTMIDWSPREQVFALMRSCRAVVLPSLWTETWGLIVSEALSQSVPVLVSERAGSSELVTRFGGGVVFDPGSERSYDAAIRRVVRERTALAADATRAFEAAGLDESAYVRKLVDLVRESFGMELIARSEVSR
jgi:glycosyltransferase involved in cell wall biosynthesis